jgi:hypothetical protein
MLTLTGNVFAVIFSPPKCLVFADDLTSLDKFRRFGITVPIEQNLAPALVFIIFTIFMIRFDYLFVSYVAQQLMVDLDVTMFYLHSLLVLVSGCASFVGLMMLQNDTQMEVNKHLLMSMTFGCWLSYCISWGLLRLTPPELEYMIASLRFATGVSYLFTFVCALSLPLYEVDSP